VRLVGGDAAAAAAALPKRPMPLARHLSMPRSQTMTPPPSAPLQRVGSAHSSAGGSSSAGAGSAAPGRLGSASRAPALSALAALQRERGDAFIDRLPRGLTPDRFDGAPTSPSVAQFVRRVKRLEERRVTAEVQQMLLSGDQGADGAHLSAVYAERSPAAAKAYTEYETAALATLELHQVPGQLDADIAALALMLDELAMAWNGATHARGVTLVRWAARRYWLLATPTAERSMRDAARALADALVLCVQEFEKCGPGAARSAAGRCLPPLPCWPCRRPPPPSCFL